MNFSLYTWQLNFGQNISIKWRCHEEHLREPIREPFGNLWEHKGIEGKKLKIPLRSATKKEKSGSMMIA